MPGSNKTAMQGNTTITIEYMDTGNMTDLLGTPQQPVTLSTSLNGPPTQSMRVKPVDKTQIQGIYLASAKWE